jgi:hypothetical protein
MTAKVENLLAEALVPVEPPTHISGNMESRLQALTESAQEELESWELSAMRNPRNWVRPVAAAVVVTAAGSALVVVRVHARHKHRAAVGEPRHLPGAAHLPGSVHLPGAAHLRGLASWAVRDLAHEARRVIPEHAVRKLGESTQPVLPAHAGEIPKVSGSHRLQPAHAAREFVSRTRGALPVLHGSGSARPPRATPDR